MKKLLRTETVPEMYMYVVCVCVHVMCVSKTIHENTIDTKLAREVCTCTHFDSLFAHFASSFSVINGRRRRTMKKRKK